MIKRIQQWRTRRIAEKGYTLLSEGEYEEALELSAVLEKRKYSAAFEIGAQALMALGKFDEAIVLLERGVVEAPDAWSNWQLLGNIRSDQGDLTGASAAYEMALGCSEAPVLSVLLNQAILAHRTGNPKEALSILSSVSSGDATELTVLARVRSSCLLETENIEGSIEEAESALAQSWLSKAESQEVANLYTVLGRARLQGNNPAKEVENCVFEALRFQPSDDGALALLRDLRGRYSPDAQYFRILFRGDQLNDELRRYGEESYYVNYDIVASSLEEAQQFASEIESKTLESSLAVEESESIELRPEDPKGVYQYGGRFFFTPD